MACGTPIVASDIDVLREVAGDAGSYAAIDDPAAWRDTIVRLLDEREERFAEWGRRRERALARASLFSWSKYAREMESLYARLSGAQTAAGGAELMPAPLRVLHVGNSTRRRRAASRRWSSRFAKASGPGVDSQVLVANTSAHTVREVWRGVPVTRVASFGSIGSVGICPGFPFALAAASRDVTVLHEPNPVALVSDCVTLSRGPLVVWFHSEVVRPQWKYELMYRPFLRRVPLAGEPDRGVVAAACRVRARAERLPPQVRRHPLRPRHIAPGRDAGSIAARAAGIAREFPGPRVLFVGRLVPYKGVDVLIDAMAGVQATCPHRRRRSAARIARVACGLSRRVIPGPFPRWRVRRRSGRAPARLRSLRAAVRDAPGNLWRGPARGDGVRAPSREHRPRNGRAVGESNTSRRGWWCGLEMPRPSRRR
jgi:glycosyltransferase involved in cell wall biosynthesis